MFPGVALFRACPTHTPVTVEPTWGEHMDHQEQHAEMLTKLIVPLEQMLAGITAMLREQAETNRQFLGALHDQAERQTFALEQIAAQSAAALPAAVVLQRMTATDDAQSFLDFFKVTAGACAWMAVEWAVRLLPPLDKRRTKGGSGAAPSRQTGSPGCAESGHMPTGPVSGGSPVEVPQGQAGPAIPVCSAAERQRHQMASTRILSGLHCKK